MNERRWKKPKKKQKNKKECERQRTGKMQGNKEEKERVGIIFNCVI